MSSQMFTRCTSVIDSCTTPVQIETAIKYIDRAALGKHITMEEWDFLFSYCEAKMTFLIVQYEMWKEG